MKLHPVPYTQPHAHTPEHLYNQRFLQVPGTTINSKVVVAYDHNPLYLTYAEANRYAKALSIRYRQYITAIHKPEGWMLTNRYDPRAKILPGCQLYEQVSFRPWVLNGVKDYNLPTV